MARSAAGMAGETSGGGTAAGARTAVLLDAMGTLLRFEDPVPRLRAALRARCGVDVGRGRRARRRSAPRSRTTAPTCTRGATPRRSPDLRARAAEAMRPALGAAFAGGRPATRSPPPCSTRSRSPPTRTPRRRCARCARAAARWSSSPTGTPRCTSASPRPGLAALRRRRGRVGRARRRQARPGDLRARARARGRRAAARRLARRRRRRAPTSRARSRPGSGRCWCTATGAPPDLPGVPVLAGPGRIA